MKTIHKILFLSIFMLIALGTTENLYSQLNNCGCENKEVILSDGLYQIIIGNCVAEVSFQYLKCGDPANKTFTISINDIILRGCTGTPPSEEEVMKIAKVQLMLYTHFWKGNSQYLPDDYEVNVQAPNCFKFTVDDPYYVSTSTYSPTDNNCPNVVCGGCCSNTYTLDLVGGNSVYITDIERSASSDTFCNTTELCCENVCSETEIEEGDLAYYYRHNSCIEDNFDDARFFAGELDSYSMTYSSAILFKDNLNNTYDISPASILTKSSSSVSLDTKEKMSEFMMDLLHDRVSVFGVNPTDTMNIKMKSCWEYTTTSSGTISSTTPCQNSECCELKVTFTQMPFPNADKYIATVSNISSGTCSLPCFEVCNEIYNYINGQIVRNAKPVFEVENENNLHFSFNIYPNPSSGITNLEFNSEETGKIEINIVTLDGQIIAKRIFDKKGNSYKYELNTKSFTNGAYFIKLSLNGVSIISKKITILN